MSIGIITDITKYNTGIVSIGTDSITISGHDNLKPALIGDTVEVVSGVPSQPISPKINKVINRASHKNIPGILDICSKVIYGMSKKGVPIYLFKPSNESYPCFLVASNLKRELSRAENHYVLINFHEWKPDKFVKLPTGTIASILGPIGSLEVEYEHIIHKWGLHKPTFKNIIKHNPTIPTQISQDITSLKLLASGSQIEPNRLDLLDLDIFSIDPKGCEDIDDALHIRHDGDIGRNVVEVGVHIADVGHWIQEGSPLDVLARAGLSTVYAPHRRIDILPAEYSTNICSLKPLETRYAVSTLFYFNNATGELLNYKFALTVIKSKKAFSYEEANEAIAGKTHQGLLLLRDLVYKMSPSRSSDPSHVIVETFMILTNKVVAETLYGIYPMHTILRTHKGSKKDQIQFYQSAQLQPLYSNNNEEIDKLKRHLDIIGMESAEYIIANADDTTADTTHVALGLKYYTHFTSPIRRYVDLINHRLLTSHICNQSSELGNNTSLLQVCVDFNNLSKRLSRAESEFSLLTLISQLGKKNEIIKTIAYITDLGEIGNPKITIFIPQYNLNKRLRLYHRDTDVLKEYIYCDSTLTITDKQTKETITYKLLQKLAIEIIPNMQSEILTKKIRIILTL